MRAEELLTELLLSTSRIENDYENLFNFNLSTVEEVLTFLSKCSEIV
jgi:hypothetical protein